MQMTMMMALTMLAGIALADAEIFSEEIGENLILDLSCVAGEHIKIVKAKYWAPHSWFCSDQHDAFSKTSDHCNHLESCSINTAPNGFYGDPCFGAWKKLAVSYTCQTCDEGKLLVKGPGCIDPCEGGNYIDQENGCTLCEEGTYSPGGSASSCSNCPSGKEVAMGYIGTSESDCSLRAEIGENQVLNLSCDDGEYLEIENAKYFAPHFSLCTPLENAFPKTRDHCRFKGSCELDTSPDRFYVDPCWGQWKQLLVWYKCQACDAGEQLVEGVGCQEVPAVIDVVPQVLPQVLPEVIEVVLPYRRDNRCGPKFPLADGSPGQCNPDHPKGATCCNSKSGRCTSRITKQCRKQGRK